LCLAVKLCSVSQELSFAMLCHICSQMLWDAGCLKLGNRSIIGGVSDVVI